MEPGCPLRGVQVTAAPSHRSTCHTISTNHRDYANTATRMKAAIMMSSNERRLRLSEGPASLRCWHFSEDSCAPIEPHAQGGLAPFLLASVGREAA